MKKINTIQEYQKEKRQGKEPLVDFGYELEFSLRLFLQKELFFPKGHRVVSANDRFYHWMFENKQRLAIDRYCEECSVPIYEYHSGYISHILPRGGYPEMAHDTRNANILCRHHHRQWEHWKHHKTMKIYPANQIIITELKYDYHVRK